jgi:hypothetical protein
LGDEATVLDVSERYHAMYLVLEESDKLGALQDLYDDPQSSSAFIYLGEAAGAHLYRVNPAP